MSDKHSSFAPSDYSGHSGSGGTASTAKSGKPNEVNPKIYADAMLRSSEESKKRRMANKAAKEKADAGKSMLYCSILDFS